VPAKAKKRRRLGVSTTAADRLKAEYPNHVWALDYQHDATEDGHELKFLNVVDEFTREALAIDAEETVAVLERLATERGAPRQPQGRQRPRADRRRLARMVSAGQDRHRLHRAGLALAEPLRGVLQRPHARRTAERRGVHLPGGVQGAGRRLAHRLQRQPPTLGARDDVARALRASLRSPSGLATRGGDQERYSTQTNPGLSLGWTDERGPATPARSSAFLAALATPVSASSASPNGGATYTTTSSGRRFARHPRRSANLALRATVVAPTRASTCGTSLKIFIGFCV
jgi:hypothetical protein